MHSFSASAFLPVLALAAGAAAKGVWTTPHDSYSSSIGVLGCKINTDRVAYWPGSVDCDNICVKLSYNSRSVHLLRIDQSGGAYDISYDAWNYLQTGKSAATSPITGGTVAMEYEEVDASECADLIYTEGSKLPLSASNSMNFLASCLAQPDSYVARNHVLFNICDAVCTLGHDEECSLDLNVSNQPSCPHTLGLTSPLAGAPVYNIQYQSGKTVEAGSGKEVAPQAKTPVEANPSPAAAPPAAPVGPAPAVKAVPTPAPAVFKEETADAEPSPKVSSSPRPSPSSSPAPAAAAPPAEDASASSSAPSAAVAAPSISSESAAGPNSSSSSNLVVSTAADVAQPSSATPQPVTSTMPVLVVSAKPTAVVNYNSTASGAAESSAAGVATTFSVVTASSTRAAPSSTDTVRVDTVRVNAGGEGARASSFALLASVVACALAIAL